ncbi:MAG TPA: hypothetical protein VI168_14470 [Croceibacterium sp.]
MTRLEGAYSVIRIGEQKDAEGDLRRAHLAYETAITDFMHLSLVECSSTDQVKAWLSRHPFERAAERYIAITDEVIANPHSEWIRFFQSGNYLLIAFSHFFCGAGSAWACAVLRAGCN